MTHIEIPITDHHHLTLVHFERTLDAAQGQIVLEGLEALAEAYRGAEVNMWWGFNDLRVGPMNNIPASSVEFETDLVPEFRRRLVAGLKGRGLPVSEAYAGWLPHITNPPTNITTWSYVRHRGVVTLVQKPHRVDGPFPAVS